MTNQQNILQNLLASDISTQESNEQCSQEVNLIVNKINQLEINQQITQSINSPNNNQNKELMQFDKVVSKENLIIQDQSSSKSSINILTQRSSLSTSSDNISTFSQKQNSPLISNKQFSEIFPSSSRSINNSTIQNTKAEPEQNEIYNIQSENDDQNEQKYYQNKKNAKSQCQQKSNHRNQAYKIEKKIGDGCSAVVYLAKLLNNTNNVPNNNFIAVKKFKKRKEMHFQNEKNILELINGNHPNIMKIQSINIPQMEIQSEYYSNGDILDFVIKRGMLKESQARYFFRRICSAILYLKQNNICHRDLKLENILFDAQLNPIIIDFAFATVNQSNFTEFIGTEGYQPPEVLLKQSYDGHSFDIFSLGVILFEMIMGKPPFKEAHIDTGLYKKFIENNEEYWEVFKKYCDPSQEVKDLIFNLLNNDQYNRITIEEVFKHPWMCESQPEEQILQ